MAVSLEQRATALRAITCQNCGVRETQLGSAMMTCGGCHNQNYCSRECQRTHWPTHKPKCREYQAHAAQLKAIGVDALVEQYHDWVKEHRGLLSLLVHGELKGITQSHVLMVSTAYMPGQYPLFKVLSHQVVPLDECDPPVAQAVRSDMAVPGPWEGKEDVVTGYAIVTCAAIPGFTRLCPLGMLRNDPQPAKYKGRLVSLLNMGASNALRVMNSEDT